MKIPLEITYRGLQPSDVIDEVIRKQVAALERRYDRIMACRVSVEAPHRHQKSGNRFRVRVDLTVPGKEIVAGRSHEADGAHEDLRVALRDAFRACRRQLQDHARVRRGDVKAHALIPPEETAAAS
jgi:ribosome-associated translation inhibitor RaiA